VLVLCDEKGECDGSRWARPAAVVCLAHVASGTGLVGFGIDGVKEACDLPRQQYQRDQRDAWRSGTRAAWDSVLGHRTGEARGKKKRGARG